MSKWCLMGVMMIAPIIVSCSAVDSEKPAHGERSVTLTQAQVDSVVAAKLGLVRVPLDLHKAEALGVDLKSHELIHAYLDLATKRYLYVEHSRGNDALYCVESVSAQRMRGTSAERAVFAVSKAANGFVINRVNDEALLSLEDAVPTTADPGDADGSSPKPKKQKDHSFCQREGQETYAQCYNREVDEFCSDFVGRVAYETNLSVRLLIAASCTCHQ